MTAGEVAASRRRGLGRRQRLGAAPPRYPSDLLDGHAELAAAHRALWRAGYGCDVVLPGDPLEGYRLLVLPALYLAADTTADWVRAHVEAGGHLLVSYLSGVADPHARVRLGGYPGAYRDLLGIRVEEFHPLAADEQVLLSGGGADLVGDRAPDRRRAEYACVGGVLDGRPAVTRRRAGAGTAWYLSTDPTTRASRRLVTEAARVAGVHPVYPDAPPGVEAVRRCGPRRAGLFLLNHTDRPQPVPVDGVDLLTGAPVDGQVTLPAGGTAVIRELASDVVPPARGWRALWPHRR